MRCECILSVSKTLKGKCEHKIGRCKNRARKVLRSPGMKRYLCFGCSNQYQVRWKCPIKKLKEVTA